MIMYLDGFTPVYLYLQICIYYYIKTSWEMLQLLYIQ